MKRVFEASDGVSGSTFIHERLVIGEDGFVAAVASGFALCAVGTLSCSMILRMAFRVIVAAIIAVCSGVRRLEAIVAD